MIGAMYSTAIGFDPEMRPWEDLSLSFYGVYGGYTFLNNDTLCLTGLVGYFAMSRDYEYDDYDGWEYYVYTYQKIDLASIAAGLKATLNFDPLTISALLLYGISNEIDIDYYYYDYFDGYEEWFYDTLDVDATMLELKAVYQFSDTIAAYIVYRGVYFDLIEDYTGFGAGIQMNF